MNEQPESVHITIGKHGEREAIFPFFSLDHLLDHTVIIRQVGDIVSIARRQWGSEAPSYVKTLPHGFVESDGDHHPICPSPKDAKALNAFVAGIFAGKDLAYTDAIDAEGKIPTAVGDARHEWPKAALGVALIPPAFRSKDSNVCKRQ